MHIILSLLLYMSLKYDKYTMYTTRTRIHAYFTYPVLVDLSGNKVEQNPRLFLLFTIEKQFLSVPVPSGNQTWQWKMSLLIIFDWPLKASIYNGGTGPRGLLGQLRAHRPTGLQAYGPTRTWHGRSPEREGCRRSYNIKSRERANENDDDDDDEEDDDDDDDDDDFDDDDADADAEDDGDVEDDTVEGDDEKDDNANVAEDAGEVDDVENDEVKGEEDDDVENIWEYGVEEGEGEDNDVEEDDRSQDRDEKDDNVDVAGWGGGWWDPHFVLACAIDMHMDMSQITRASSCGTLQA